MSSPLRVLSIFGTRPEAVKMAPVVQAVNPYGNGQAAGRIVQALVKAAQIG